MGSNAGTHEITERIGDPNTRMFNILTYVQGKYGKVNEFLEKMEEEGLELDIVTYNVLVDSYCKKGRLKDVIYLYYILYRRGVVTIYFIPTIPSGFWFLVLFY